MDKWISVKERLPEKQDKYIVTYETRTGKRHVEERWFYGSARIWTKGNGAPIAWQPMPKPYK